jgi:hypothetical protein
MEEKITSNKNIAQICILVKILHKSLDVESKPKPTLHMHTVAAIASSSSSASHPWGRGAAMALREEGDEGGHAAMVARHSSHRPATFLSAVSPAFRSPARRPPLPRRLF